MAVTVRDVIIRVRIQGAPSVAPGGGVFPGAGFPGSGLPGRTPAAPPSPTPLLPGRLPGGGGINPQLSQQLNKLTSSFANLNLRLSGAILELINLATWSRAVTRTTFAVRGAGLTKYVLGAAAIAAIPIAINANLPGGAQRFRRGRAALARGGRRFLGALSEAYGGAFFETDETREGNINAPAFARSIYNRREQARADAANREQLRFSGELSLSEARSSQRGLISSLGTGTPSLSRFSDEIFNARELARRATDPGARLLALEGAAGAAGQQRDAVAAIGQQQVQAERDKLQLLERQVELEKQKAATLRDSIQQGAFSFSRLNPGERRQVVEAAGNLRRTGVLPRSRRELDLLATGAGISPNLSALIGQAAERRFLGDAGFETVTDASRDVLRQQNRASELNVAARRQRGQIAKTEEEAGERLAEAMIEFVQALRDRNKAAIDANEAVRFREQERNARES